MPIVLARCLAARADLSVRVKLPVDVREVIGCVHVNRSLRTDGLSLVVRLARKVAFKIDAIFEATRRQIGFGYDERLIVDHDSVATVGTTIRRRSDPSFVAENSASIDQTELPMPTLSTIYGRFLDDPAKRRSARDVGASLNPTRGGRCVGAINSHQQISRAACRACPDILRWKPVNVAKKYPRLAMRGAAERAKLDKRIATINATNLDVYADNLGRRIATRQPSRQSDRDNNRLEASRWQRNRQPHTGRAADSVDFGAEQADV